MKFEQAEAEAKAEAAKVEGVGTNLGTVKMVPKPEHSQVVESK